MKSGHVSRLIACGVTLLAALVFTSSVHAAAGKAVVRAVRGQAQFTERGETGPLKVGKTLREGASIATSAASEVDLFLGQNGPVIRLRENSELTLDQLVFERLSQDETDFQTQLNLKSGQILGNVKKLAATSRYEVKTPTSVAGIRGTQYAMGANGSVTVVAGQIEVVYFNAQGQFATITVNAGETFTPPEDPNALPTQEDVEETPPGLMNALIASLIQSTAYSDPGALQAAIAEITAARAARAALNAPPGSEGAAAAAAAQSTMDTILAAANQIGTEGSAATRNAVQAAVRNAQSNVQEAAAAGAAAIASSRAAAAARDAGLNPGQVMQAALDAGRAQGESAALASGATQQQATVLGNQTANIVTQIVNNPDTPPINIAGFTPPAPPTQPVFIAVPPVIPTPDPDTTVTP